jgi:hypothetical protein
MGVFKIELPIEFIVFLVKGSTGDKNTYGHVMGLKHESTEIKFPLIHERQLEIHFRLYLKFKGRIILNQYCPCVTASYSFSVFSVPV